MASKLNYSDVVKSNITTKRKKFTMNFQETFKHSDWTQFRNIAAEIQNHVKRIGLGLKLDDVTYGDGACFIIAVMQQLLRSDVRIYLPDDILRIAEEFDVMAFRKRVAMFMLTSKNPSVLNYKLRFERIAEPIIKKSWTEYWNFMMERFTWADTHFVQGTAYMLGLDIWIVTTKSKSSNPYTKSLADMHDPQSPSIAPPLILGLKGECHYQSLLQHEENNHFANATVKETDSSKEGNRNDSNVTYADVVKEKRKDGKKDQKDQKENTLPKQLTKIDDFKKNAEIVKEIKSSVNEKKNAKNPKYDEKSANAENGWTAVVSKKRKNASKKTLNAFNVSGKNSACNKVITIILHVKYYST